MLSNVELAESLRSLARSRARSYETRTVQPELEQKVVAEGWQVRKRNKQTIRLEREKTHAAHFEDRVWTLLFRMGFDAMSGERGAVLALEPKNPDSPKNQIDAVAIDSEIALAIECKSSQQWAKRVKFDEELAKFSGMRQRFSTAVRTQFPSDQDRAYVFAFWTRNATLSDIDRARAKQVRVALLNETDLAYYEQLYSHIGAAAKYQLLADLLEGRSIPGLAVKIPAVQIKMGGCYCYNFAISPEYLLKVSYVAHRAKGGSASVEAYQRMLKRSRLNRIREFIDEDGIFPTNIVINLQEKTVDFQKVKQEGDREGGVLGWMRIAPSYKSAWIIDGQHRLFAYSGHERAAKSVLSVLAFEGLSAAMQAKLFIEINAKQKRVPRSLLEELYSELNWDSERPYERVSAVISRAVQQLDADSSSPLFGRIQTADESKDDTRCISLTSVFTELEKGQLFIARERNDEVLEYGPLWAKTNEATLRRTKQVLNAWLESIATMAASWWEKGAGEGGGLAMNDGIVSLLSTMRSVFTHLHGTTPGGALIALDNEDLCSLLRPYADALGEYLAGTPDEVRRSLRDLRGGQGQLKRMRIFQKGLRDRFSDFNPHGLDEFLESERNQTNLKAREVIDKIERMLQTTVVEELKKEYGADAEQWWILGVPKEIRKQVTGLQEEDDNKRGGKEFYFNLIHYKHVISKHWKQFGSIFANGVGGKDKQLSWMDFVNDKRNAVHHVSSGILVSIEDFERLQNLETWLRSAISAKEAPGAIAAAAGDEVNDPSDE